MKFLFEFWPFEISGHLMLLLSCANRNLRTMSANVLKFPHKKIGENEVGGGLLLLSMSNASL